MENRITPRLVMKNALEAMNYYEELFIGAKKVDHRPLTQDMAQYHNLTMTDEQLLTTTIHGVVKFYGEAVYFVDAMKEEDINAKGAALLISFDESKQEDKELAEKLVAHLSPRDDIKITMEFSEQFWGDKYMSFIDKYGVNWEINVYDSTKPTYQG